MGEQLFGRIGRILGPFVQALDPYGLLLSSYIKIPLQKVTSLPVFHSAATPSSNFEKGGCDEDFATDNVRSV